LATLDRVLCNKQLSNLSTGQKIACLWHCCSLLQKTAPATEAIEPEQSLNLPSGAARLRVEKAIAKTPNLIALKTLQQEDYIGLAEYVYKTNLDATQCEIYWLQRSVSNFSPEFSSEVHEF